MDHAGKDTIVSTPSTASVWTKVGLTAAAVAAIGAVFGSFYLGTVFSPAPRETKSVVAAETTGSAPAQDNIKKEEAQTIANAPAPTEAADAANCREQTWPYIARPCLSNETGGRGVRVISTDKLADPVIGVVEAPPDTVINRKAAAPIEPPKAQTAAPNPTVANNPGPASAVSLKSGASLGAVAISPAAAAPTPEPQTPEPVVAAVPPPNEPPAQAAVAAPQPAVQAAVAVEPQVVPDKRIEKSKRKAAKRQDKENERFKTTVAESDDSDDEPAIERRNSRGKGRVVERWTERDYEVRSHDGSGTRRVIVRSGDDRERDTYSERSVSTERSGGGFPNIFGAIFGGGN